MGDVSYAKSGRESDDDGGEWFGGKNKVFVDVGERLPTNGQFSFFGTMNRKSFVSSSLGRFGAWEYHHSIRVEILDRLSLSELFQLTHT